MPVICNNRSWDHRILSMKPRWTMRGRRSMAERALENFLFFFKFLYFSRGHKCFPKRQREREEATLPTGCGHTATASPPFLHLIGILVHFLSHQSQDSNHSQSRGIQPLTTRPQVQLTLETFYLGEISPFRTNGHHSPDPTSVLLNISTP